MNNSSLTADITAKEYVVGIRTDEQYLIKSSDTDPVSFFKLLLNLIMQETYKVTSDHQYIDPRVILDVLHKNIDDANNFAKEHYDYDKLLKVELNHDKKPNLLLGHRIKNEALKLKRKLDEETSLGLEGKYLIFLNADDQVYTLKDNEDRDLVLVFLYFMDSCKKYKLNPYRILRAIRERAFALRQKMILKIQDESNSGKPLLLFKIANGGRLDFYRDVDEFEREGKIKSVLLKRATYQFHFCDFFVSTEKTVYMLISQQESADALEYIKDVFHQFMIDVSSDTNTNTAEYTQKVLAAYKEGYEKRKAYINNFFPKVKSNSWINSENIPVVKPTFGEPNGKDRDRIFDTISSLYESDVVAGFFYMWHSERDADVNGGGSVSYKNSKLEDMAAILLQFFGYTALAYPDLKDALLHWNNTYIIPMN